MAGHCRQERAPPTSAYLLWLLSVAGGDIAGGGLVVSAGGDSDDVSAGDTAAVGGLLPTFMPADALGEVNFCGKIEENMNLYGMVIKSANRSNHWFPATISTCCASCRN